MALPSQQTIQRGDIFDTLAAIDRGGLVHELTDGVREAVLASVDTLKKSTVTLEIVFDPDSKTEAMRVSARVKVKTPSPPPRASLFFPTPDGNLSRMDIRQREMFPEAGSREVTTVATVTEKVDSDGVVTSSDQL